MREIQEIVDRLAASDETFQAEVRPTLSREPFEVAPEAAIVRTVTEEAEGVLGQLLSHIGGTYWMDAALIAAAGIETVVLGPVGTGAHADEEWVDLDSVAQLATILSRTAARYCA